MPKRRTLLLAIACGLGLHGRPVDAQTVATGFDAPVPATCSFSRTARIATTLSELPEVAAAFRRQKLDIADVGEKFIPFDVEDDKSKGLPHRQFVRAYIFSDRIIVWYYRGGFGTSFHVVELMMRRDTMPNAPNVLSLTGRTLSGPLCAATQAMLAGVVGGRGW